MSCKFDKTTHRCVCGRWERGFKPACEPVRPRDECQICERQQSLDSTGDLGLHGYKRPGCGYIIGNCMGVGHKPYPATDALETYLTMVRGYIKTCKESLDRLPTLTEIAYTFPVYVNHKRESRTVTIRKGDVYRYDPETRNTLPGFDDRIKVETAKLQSEIAFASKDESRVVKRIANAKSL